VTRNVEMYPLLSQGDILSAAETSCEEELIISRVCLRRELALSGVRLLLIVPGLDGVLLLAHPKEV